MIRPQLFRFKYIVSRLAPTDPLCSRTEPRTVFWPTRKIRAFSAVTFGQLSPWLCYFPPPCYNYIEILKNVKFIFGAKDLFLKFFWSVFGSDWACCSFEGGKKSIYEEKSLGRDLNYSSDMNHQRGVFVLQEKLPNGQEKPHSEASFGVRLCWGAGFEWGSC